MKVEFFRWPAELASGRLRGSIIQAELLKMGVEPGGDVVVASKHGWSDALLNNAERVVFDVCDDHFDGHHGAHYVRWCMKADAVTCNTPGMRDIILNKTGREAFVIPDPYEQPEKPARLGESLLWFGHSSNMRDLARVLPDLLDRPLRVVTNGVKGCDEWTPEVMDAAFDEAGMVIIPTGNKRAKSANRAVESIRRGLWVVAEPLPSYAELGIWQGDIPAGIEWALSHRETVLKRIKAAQDYVREEFSPRRIAGLWLDVFKGL